MEIVEGEFPVGKKDQWCHAGQETLCPKFPVGKKHQWRYTKQETLPIKKSPVPKHGGIFLFHLIVIVLIQASCEVEEGRGVGGVD